MLKLMRAPSKYVQGKDAFAELYENIKELGNSILFVCSNSGFKASKEKIEKSFEGTDMNYKFEVFKGISSRSEIEKMRALVKENNIDIVQVLEEEVLSILQKQLHIMRSFLL